MLVTSASTVTNTKRRVTMVMISKGLLASQVPMQRSHGEGEPRRPGGVTAAIEPKHPSGDEVLMEPERFATLVVFVSQHRRLLFVTS
jgi:hypothetical protein